MKPILTLTFLLGFASIASAQYVEDCVTEFGNGYQARIYTKHILMVPVNVTAGLVTATFE